jgi:hypothetical protein
MQKATNEWNETIKGPWDWEKNKDNVTAFMEDGARRAGKNETYFTLGMRGEGDGPIQADDPVAVLEDVFATQRQILAKYYGSVSGANRMFSKSSETTELMLGRGLDDLQRSCDILCRWPTPAR